MYKGIIIVRTLLHFFNTKFFLYIIIIIQYNALNARQHNAAYTTEYTGASDS